MKKQFLWGCVAAVAASATFPTWADTHTVASGETETLSNVTETSRFVKNGEGTLVLGGNNSFKRVTMSAGDLKISGGTTSISDTPGSNVSDANHIFAMSGGRLTVADGATLAMSTAGTGYAIQHGGTFLVTNATLDVSDVGQYMNGFQDNGGFTESRFVIATGGVVRAKVFRPSGATSSSLKEMSSLDLNPGGKLYLNWFFGDTGIRYGRINFNGGVVYPLVAGATVGTRLFRNETSAKTWTEGGVVPTVREGGMYIHTISNNTISVSIQSGAEKDGGFHHSGKAVIYWHAKNSTYNGGTWLESDNGAVLAVNGSSGDSSLGALPSSPATNIWVTGSNHTLFSDGSEMAIHPNRMLFVKHGKKLYLGTQGRLVIGGEIHGEIPENQSAPTGTAVHVRNDNGGWSGTVVLNPGAGHTNDIGRLVNYGRLEITSGVTRVAASVDNGTDDAKALVYVNGNNSDYASYRGELRVNGGTLACSQAYKYIVARQYAQVEVTNGGRIDMPKLTYVNGLSSPATLTIADGGTVCVTNLQIANGTTAVVNLNRGGTLIVSRFWSSASSYGIVNFDGGCLQSPNTGELGFGLQDGAARWVNARVYVKEGGAVFATPTQHLWIRLPLLSGVAEGEKDGGLTYLGSDDKALVMATNNFYNGATVVAGGTLQMRVDNAVLPGSTLVMSNGAWVSFCMYDKKVNGSYATSTQTEQWLGRLEGDGYINYCESLHVTNAIAPSARGTAPNGRGRLLFCRTCDLRGDLEIRGDADGCGYIMSEPAANFALDISHLKLKIVDVDAMDAHAKSDFYKILDAPNGYTGKFGLADDWPRGWTVKYAADGKSAYVYRQNGTQMIFR